MTSDKSGTKSVRARAFILLTAAVVVLSAAAVAISINITSVMLKKHDQLAGSGPYAAASLKKEGSGASELVDVGKAGRLPLYFNGLTRGDMVCYVSGSGKSLLPIDVLFGNIGMEFGIVNSDDAFVADVNGKRLVLLLGTAKGAAGGAPLSLDTASTAAESHVLAPPAVLDGLEGFRYCGDTGNGAVFAYYRPPSLDKKYSGLRLFKLNGKRLEISDIYGGDSLSYIGSGLAAIDEAVCSESADFMLARSAEQYYLVDGSNYRRPVRLDIKGSWRLSADGSFLYSLDKSAKSWLIYDVESASVKKLRDIYSAVGPDDGTSLADARLLGYETGRSFTRLDFSAPGGGVYTVVSRGGRLAARGSSKYSPDRRRLLLYEKTDGWSMAGSDGRNIVHFKDASAVSWVDDDRVLLHTADGRLEVYEIKDGSRHGVEVPFAYVGKAEDGRLFFTKGNELYQTVNGVEEKIAGLPWKCDYAVSAAPGGPVIVLSGEADVMFALAGDNILPLGIPELFPNRPAAGDGDAGFGRNAAFSPDGNRIALLQKGDKFLEVVLSGLKEWKREKLTLDYVPGASEDGSPVNLKWLGNDSLMIYTTGRAWLVDSDSGRTYLGEWPVDSPIAGTFRLP